MNWIWMQNIRIINLPKVASKMKIRKLQSKQSPDYKKLNGYSYLLVLMFLYIRYKTKLINIFPNEKLKQSFFLLTKVPNSRLLNWIVYSHQQPCWNGKCKINDGLRSVLYCVQPFILLQILNTINTMALEKVCDVVNMFFIKKRLFYFISFSFLTTV